MSIWPNVSFKASISLLSFCLDDVCIVVNGICKSPTIIVVLSDFFPLILLVVALYILVFPGWVHIYWEVYVFLLYCHLYHYKMSTFVTFLTLKSILSDISMAHPHFSGCYFLRESFSTLSLWGYICPCSWNVSPESSMWLGFVFWSNLLLCLFIAKFSPFTFRVIIDVWGFPVAISSFVFWYLYASIVFSFLVWLLFQFGGILWFFPLFSLFLCNVSQFGIFVYVVTTGYIQKKFSYTQ